MSAPERFLKQYTKGAVMFFIGFALIIGSDKILLDSLIQEYLALFGVASMVVGGLYVLYGHFGLGLSKIFGSANNSKKKL